MHDEIRDAGFGESARRVGERRRRLEAGDHPKQRLVRTTLTVRRERATSFASGAAYEAIDKTDVAAEELALERVQAAQAMVEAAEGLA